MRKLTSVAIAYDFDGTLTPGNMQEHSFIPKIGMKSKEFWEMARQDAENNEADVVLTYMNLMLKKANEKEVPIRKSDFMKHGKSIELFDGVGAWFKRINKYGKGLELKIDHYIISSGIHEMILGNPIAKHFEKIYASSFKYNVNEVAEWPALAINFTTKTQYLFRINKGVLDVYDDKKINEYVPMEERPTPFDNMIFIGDGETDIPCFSLVKNLGGHSIAVYKPNTKNAKRKAEKLAKDKRVHFVAPADYSNKGRIDTIVKAILDKIASDSELILLGK